MNDINNIVQSTVQYKIVHKAPCMDVCGTIVVQYSHKEIKWIRHDHHDIKKQNEGIK